MTSGPKAPLVSRKKKKHPGIKLHGYYFCQEHSLCSMQRTLLGNVLNCLHGELLSHYLCHCQYNFIARTPRTGKSVTDFIFPFVCFFFFFFLFLKFHPSTSRLVSDTQKPGGPAAYSNIGRTQENVKLFRGLERDISSLPITPPWVSFRTNTFFCVALGFELLADANKKNSSFFIFYIYKNTLNMI